MRNKAIPIIMIMFGCILTPLSILALASHFGEADWTWIAQTITLFTLLIMVLGAGFYALVSWMRR